VWAFHGALDQAVLCRESEKMVECAVKGGCSARLTIYPNYQHDSWSDTYRNQQVCDWLLAHKRRLPEAEQASKQDGKIDESFAKTFG
jgi:hypothetical protein